jgi:membrane-bound ClpP family serine protease
MFAGAHVDNFNQLAVDPSFVYLVLLFGLWVAVTAAYVPGTGVIEILAVIALIIAFTIMASMPNTNWWAVLLLVLGVLSFLLVPFLNARLAILAQAGLILQAIGGAMLFSGNGVSWLLIALTVGIALAYHNLALLPLLERTRKQKAVLDDDSSLIGRAGRATTTFALSGAKYVGTVNVRSEQWTAYSKNPLSRDDDVVVSERDGLLLWVEGLKQAAPSESKKEDFS